MKKYFILISIILIPVFISGQGRRNKSEISKDVHGNYIYQNKEGVNASFSTDIFDNRIYQDNNGNEVTYSKEIWSDVFPRFNGDEKRILAWLADAFKDNRDVKEKYKRNIHGNLEYENSHGLQCSLSKSVFEEGVYKDNQGNEIKYSKEYWKDIMSDFRDNDVQAFFWLMDYCRDLKNYTEEYKVDVFGNFQYKNNKNANASLSDNVQGQKVYKDSKDNNKEYSAAVWNRILNRHKSEPKAFIMLVNRHLLSEE